MPRARSILMAGLLAALMPAASLARGGGGCLREGTLILTPSGERAIEQLRSGDAVLACGREGVFPATVQEVMRVLPATYLDIDVEGAAIQVTDEHPVETGPGVFKVARNLRPGDAVCRLVAGRVVSGTVRTVTRVPATAAAWNLLVSPAGVYAANTVVVHNKGCFLPETSVRREDGSDVPISAVQPGDRVLAFDSEGRLTGARVLKVLTHHVEEYRIVRTAQVTLKVTPEHPFFVGAGTFKTLEALACGDAIFVYDGQALCRQPLLGVETVHEPATVYNLHTDAPNTFLANGVAVHNKGGGGSHGGGSHHSRSHSSGSHGSGSSSGSPIPGLIFVGGFLAFMLIKSFWSSGSENLDHVYSPSAVAGKRDKTMKLLEFIAKQDAALNPDTLRQQVQETFLKLQECWQARDYRPMQPRLMPDLYADHVLQLEGMRRHHEINKIESVQVGRIDLVNVRYTEKPEQREFTALITASARDYYVDDRTGRKTRGDDGVATFQEFWTFQYRERAWSLREIEQTGESSVLKEDNFFESFTDAGVERVYGKLAGQQGPAGPWLEKAVSVKETQIERMLNFLVQTDRAWDRQGMIETTRRVFLGVMVAWESGEGSALNEDDLFPDLCSKLKADLEQSRAAGIATEFRNLCVRKVELLLVRNLDDNGADEFVARVRAHAQKVVRRSGTVVHQDEDVTLFEQYLTLGRLREAGVVEKRWRLKEMMTPEQAAPLVSQENLDQDSNADHLKWYYRQKRAT